MKNSTRLKSRYFTNFPRLLRHRVDRQRTRDSRWLCFKRDRSTVIHKSRACVHRLQNGRWCPLPVNKEKKGRKKKREKRKRKKKRNVPSGHRILPSFSARFSVLPGNERSIYLRPLFETPLSTTPPFPFQNHE